jgi:hypothetical protein
MHQQQQSSLFVCIEDFVHFVDILPRGKFTLFQKNFFEREDERSFLKRTENSGEERKLFSFTNQSMGRPSSEQMQHFCSEYKT